MFEQMKSFSKTSAGPYRICDIPKFDIDYRGLVKYARAKGKKVVELSDKEKSMFIRNATIEDVRRNAIKG